MAGELTTSDNLASLAVRWNVAERITSFSHKAILTLGRLPGRVMRGDMLWEVLQIMIGIDGR